MFGNHYWESTTPVVVISLIDRRGADTDVNTSVLIMLENAGIATKGLAFEPSGSRSSIVIHPRSNTAVSWS